MKFADLALRQGYDPDSRQSGLLVACSDVLLVTREAVQALGQYEVEAAAANRDQQVLVPGPQTGCPGDGGASGVADAGCAHQVAKTGAGPKAARLPAFKWVNAPLGNIKAAITGTYRAINRKHVPRYLAEFEYRFNRRYDLAAIIPRLTWAAVRTTPMPYRLLKLAEAYA